MPKRALTILATCLTTLSAFPAFAGTQEYTLVIAREIVNITGKPLERITINGTIPGPTLEFTDGDEAVVHVTNKLNEDTSVHWHGLILPGGMDGVTGFNGFLGIKPNQTFTYRFKVRQDGTYWYHAHSAIQEQDGHYGSIVIHPKDEDYVKAERDYVVLLSDFHEDDGRTIMRNLKKSSEYYVYIRRTVGDFFNDVQEQGFGKAWRNTKAWGEMRMLPTDLADVGNYTFLINGKTPEQNWTGLFKPGERIRLRFINASAMSFFDVSIPGLRMTVVSADGQPVEPVVVDEFRFGVSETYDVVVQPTQEKAYAIVAEPIDRTGFALATLAPRENMRTDAPTHRKRTLLTMADMGMAHHAAGMDHGNHASDAAEHAPDADHSSHAGHSHHASDPSDSVHAMHDASKPPVVDFDTGVPGSGWANADTPHGHKALAYKDLRYYGVQKDQRSPRREITVRLGGNMERYIWTLNGAKFGDADPIQLEHGERVRVTFINDTMMAHPMHLHGMFVQLENGQPAAKLPNKHVVIVAPGDTYSALLTADEPGEWAFHCHLLYHMAAGMMSKVVVAELDPNKAPMKPHSSEVTGRDELNHPLHHTSSAHEENNAHPGARHQTR